MRDKMELKTVALWIVVLGVIIGVIGVGLVYLGAVAKALPTGFGVLSNVDPIVRMIILIAILAVIAVLAWLAMPKGKSRSGTGEGTP
jgi:amino acid permease